MKLSKLEGLRFGKLTALHHVGFNSHRKSVWMCHCDCGLDVLVTAGNLTSGGSKTCGCDSRAAAAKRAKERNFKHGHASAGEFSSEYKTWIAMKARCKYACVESYPEYGGRGISVCQEWSSSFEVFFKDMGPKPTKKHSIDRIDPNGNYEPSNCRWANAIEQANNRRTNVNVTYGGHSGTLKSVCRKLGVNYKSVHRRLNAGWSLKRAFETKRRAAA